MRTASTLLLKQLSALLALCLLLVQPSYAKERIRYHINGPDGSTLRVVDQKGVAVAAYRYAPFGAQLIRKKPRNLHGAQGFVTGIHEANNLVYLKHRYYNPVIGRFYQPDPVTFLQGGMGQINRYQYGWNDPLTFKDPNGLQSTGQMLDEWAMSAAAGSADSTLNFELAAAVALGATWQIFGNENLSLAFDGQSYSKTGMAVDVLSILPMAKLAKLEKFNPCGCFDDDTPIATPAGLQKIVDLKVGDLVLAKDEATGALAFKPITQRFTVADRQIYKLQVVNSQGEQSVIEVSDDHPFWVLGHGWVKSIHLTLGSQLLNDRKNVLTVIGLLKTSRIETTYNLEVADYHTFFVGRDRVWVHNSGPCDVINQQIFDKLRTLRSERYAQLTDDQLMRKITNIRGGVPYNVNTGKTLFLSPDKKDILIIDPLNPMSGTMFPNNRNTKDTQRYIRDFIIENGGVKFN